MSACPAHPGPFPPCPLTSTTPRLSPGPAGLCPLLGAGAANSPELSLSPPDVQCCLCALQHCALPAGDVIEVYYGDNRFGTVTDSGTATLKPRPRVRPLLTFLPLVSAPAPAGVGLVPRSAALGWLLLSGGAQMGAELLCAEGLGGDLGSGCVGHGPGTGAGA